MVRRPHTELKNIHRNEDIWVIGAGASMNFIDPPFFEGKCTIGVNRVCRFFKCDYVVSKDARGFNELGNNLGGAKLVLSQWESGNPKTPLPDSKELHPKENAVDFEHYFFSHQRKPGEQPLLEYVGTEDIVVSYSSITSAIHLAAYMGARNIILCGHDCGMIDGQVTIKDYYKNIKPVQGDIRHYHHWLKTQIEKHTIKLKARIKEVYGTNIYSLNPFINLALEGHKYDRKGIPTQQDEHNKKKKSIEIIKKL
jgi:hypothetical protein